MLTEFEVFTQRCFDVFLTSITFNKLNVKITSFQAYRSQWKLYIDERKKEGELLLTFSRFDAMHYNKLNNIKSLLRNSFPAKLNKNTHYKRNLI